MPYAYAGRLLSLDLTTRHWEVSDIAEGEIRDYLLGSGLAAKIFHEEMDPKRDALDPASPLFIMNGLFTGTKVPAACKVSICGRSPLTGIWGESAAGGYWGAELKFAGYDGLIITGRAEEPVYIWIVDDKVVIRPAGHLWGLDTYETSERLRMETDPKAQVACVGPAGENLVRIAAVILGGREARAAGRTGMGALMASKNLKAIVVRGHGRPRYHDEERLTHSVRKANSSIRAKSIGMSEFGTAGGVIGAEAVGDFPLKNWREGSWPEGAARISGQAMVESIFVEHYRCFGCPIGCGKKVKIASGPYAGTEGHGPEYETIAGFGGMCLNDDLSSIVAANDLCNRYGLDTISTSSAIAFAMEAYERGLITQEDTDGLRLIWCNGDELSRPLIQWLPSRREVSSGEAIVEMVRRIAYREGLGELLADGVRAAAQRLGGGAADFAVHVKGLEVPYHDPRAFTSMAVNYATAGRGACHLESLSYWPGYGIGTPGLDLPQPFDPHGSFGKAKIAYDYQNYVGVYNPLGLCKFIIKGGIGPELVAEWVNLALGWGWDAEEVMGIGERLFNLKRLINLRFGIGRRDDTLPKRLLAEPRPAGRAAGVLPRLSEMLGEYYQLRGWDEDGVPRREKLAELGLLELI